MASNQTSSRSWVSLTARYTGWVWYRHGLIAKHHLPRGSLWAYWVVAPITTLYRLAWGVDIEAFLLQRHYIIDDLIKSLLAEEPRTAIIEVACGYASRGQRIMESPTADPKWIYIETDLPDVIARKSQLPYWQKKSLLKSPQHQLLVCDVLKEHGDDCLEQILSKHVPADYRVVVVSEGMVHYFDLDVISPFWQRLAGLQSRYPLVTYICDLVPIDPTNPKMKKIIQFARIVAAYARNKVPMRFGDDRQVRDFFAKFAFESLDLHSPRDFAGILPKRAHEPHPIVRILALATKMKAQGT